MNFMGCYASSLVANFRPPPFSTAGSSRTLVHETNNTARTNESEFSPPTGIALNMARLSLRQTVEAACIMQLFRRRHLRAYPFEELDLTRLEVKELLLEAVPQLGLTHNRNLLDHCIATSVVVDVPPNAGIVEPNTPPAVLYIVAKGCVVEMAPHPCVLSRGALLGSGPREYRIATSRDAVGARLVAISIAGDNGSLLEKMVRTPPPPQSSATNAISNIRGDDRSTTTSPSAVALDTTRTPLSTARSEFLPPPPPTTSRDRSNTMGSISSSCTDDQGPSRFVYSPMMFGDQSQQALAPKSIVPAVAVLSPSVSSASTRSSVTIANAYRGMLIRRPMHVRGRQSDGTRDRGHSRVSNLVLNPSPSASAFVNGGVQNAVVQIVAPVSTTGAGTAIAGSKPPRTPALTTISKAPALDRNITGSPSSCAAPLLFSTATPNSDFSRPAKQLALDCRAISVESEISAGTAVCSCSANTGSCGYHRVSGYMLYYEEAQREDTAPTTTMYTHSVPPAAQQLLETLSSSPTFNEASSGAGARPQCVSTAAPRNSGGYASSNGNSDFFYKGLSLNQLEPIAVLGEGAFGLVRLVRHTPTGTFFALKQMSKARVEATHQTRNVLHERRLMGKLDHPFILRMLGAFQDANSLFLALEYCPGGDLFNTLQRAGGTLPLSSAVYYAAAVTTVLLHLHSRGIAYRDLKPENLLLDTSGTMKVADFGFAKVLGDSGRTSTLCGTPEYLAPEVRVGEAGVIMHEYTFTFIVSVL